MTGGEKKERKEYPQDRCSGAEEVCGREEDQEEEELQLRVFADVGGVAVGLSVQVNKLLVKVLALSVGVVHALLDVGIKLSICEASQLNSTVNTVLLGRTDDTAGYNNGDLADAADVGVQPAIGNLLLVERG